MDKLVRILGGVRELFAGVISASALGLLEDSGISLRFAEKVPYIIKRKGDGLCPVGVPGMFMQVFGGWIFINKFIKK